MSNTYYAVYGASGLGCQVMPIARKTLVSQGVDTSRLVFIDDNPLNEELNGHRVLTWAQFVGLPVDKKKVTVAIANNAVREQVVGRINEVGYEHWSVQDDSVVIMDDVRIGEGAILSCFVLLTSNIRIGKFFHANHYSHVAHDCVIGDYVTFAPGVRCNGNVIIEDNVYVGTGAMLRQGTPNKPLRIGKGAVIGMGAVVLKDVPAGATVVGNPAKELLRQ